MLRVADARWLGLAAAGGALFAGWPRGRGVLGYEQARPGVGGLGPAGRSWRPDAPLACGSGMAARSTWARSGRVRQTTRAGGRPCRTPTSERRAFATAAAPLVWDLGHIASFEDLWLAHNHGGLPLLRADLAEVYDAFETPRAERGALPYLRRAEAERYMETVRERSARRSSCVATSRSPSSSARHERQHAETMLQTLALAALPDWPARRRRRRRVRGATASAAGPVHAS